MAAGGGSSLEDLLQNYTTPMPDIVNRYEQNLTKGGFLDMPSFKELFDSYRTLGEKETKRRSAALNESFGSQGARYSSDLLAGQGRLQSDLFDQLLNKASEYQLGLRGEQQKELSSLANMRYGASEAGMNRFWQDFLRRTSPPPLYGDLSNTATNYGLPPTVI